MAVLGDFEKFKAIVKPFVLNFFVFAICCPQAIKLQPSVSNQKPSECWDYKFKIKISVCWIWLIPLERSKPSARNWEDRLARAKSVLNRFSDHFRSLQSNGRYEEIFNWVLMASNLAEESAGSKRQLAFTYGTHMESALKVSIWNQPFTNSRSQTLELDKLRADSYGGPLDRLIVEMWPGRTG